jgi:hypothetical protein
MVSESSFSFKFRPLLVAIVVATFAIVTVQQVSQGSVNASNGCTHGVITTSTETDAMFTNSTLEADDPGINQFTQLHRYTRVLFTSDGSADAVCTWTPPANISFTQVLAIGGGGAGGAHMGGGGGGGGVALKKLVPFVGGNTYSIQVGAGGASAANSCSYAVCNGGIGGTSSIYSGSTKILSAGGGVGGAGGMSAPLSTVCVFGDGCGGGGGAGVPIVPSNTNLKIIPGGNGGFSWGLASPASSRNGSDGFTDAGPPIVRFAGGGGGAGWNDYSQPTGAEGIGGNPLPAVGTMSAFAGHLYGSGGSGVSTPDNTTWNSVDGLPWYVDNSYLSSGGSSASNRTNATAGLDTYGGGGGGGVRDGYTDQSGFHDSVRLGGRGGNGQVTILYPQLPVIAGSASVTHHYGFGTLFGFTATGGNNNIFTPTDINSTVSYRWSVKDTNGLYIPGVAIDSTGLLVLSPNMSIGTISAVITATDGMNSVGSFPVTITTDQSPQSTVAFTTAAPSNQHLTGNYYPQIAGGDSTGSFAITVDAASSSVCTIASSANGSAVSFIGAGTCTLHGQHLGDTRYLDSMVATQSFSVTRASQSNISFSSTAPTQGYVGGDTYAAKIVGGLGVGSVNITVDNNSAAVCSISSSGNPATVEFDGAGSCVINAQKAGDTYYNDSNIVHQTISVSAKLSQSSLSFGTNLPNQLNVGNTVTVTPSGGDGSSQYALAIASYATSVCSLSGYTITAVSNGYCVFTLDRSGDSSHVAASQLIGAFQVVSGRNMTLSTPTQKIWTYSGTDVVTSVGASVSAGLPFTVNFTKTSDSSNCSFGHPGRYDLAFTGVGICTIFVEENDNTYSYTRSPDYTFYVIAPGDVTAPTVLNVTAPGYNGRFDAGRAVDVAVKFSESVVVTGSPRIQLSTGTTNQWATYVSGSYTDTLVFRYTIQSGDYSDNLDYVSTASLSLNSGTIKDFSNNNATLTLPVVGSVNSLSQGAAVAVGATTTTTSTTTTTTSTSTTTTTTTTIPVTTTTTTSTSTTTTTTVPAAPPSTPLLAVAQRSLHGYQFNIRNFDPGLTYTLTPPNGATVSWVNQSVGLAQVVGLTPGQSATVSVAADDGVSSSTATIAGVTLRNGVQPSFGSPQAVDGGFRVSILNFDNSATYYVTAGSAYISSGSLVVTDLGSGESGSATLQVIKEGYDYAQASVTGTAAIATTTTTTTTTTSLPPSSNSPSTSIALATTSAAPAPSISVKTGKLVSLSKIASTFSVVVAKGSKLSATISGASAKICKVLGANLKGLKKGSCTVTLMVKPVKGNSTKKSVKVSVT